MDNVQDSFWYDKIVEQVTRCDEAEKRTDMTGTVNNDTTNGWYFQANERCRINISVSSSTFIFFNSI